MKLNNESDKKLCETKNPMGPSSNQMNNEANTNNQLIQIEPQQQYEHILKQLLQQQQQHLNLSGTNEDPLRFLSNLFPLFQLNIGQQSSPLLLLPLPNSECSEVPSSINNQPNTIKSTDSLAQIKIEYNSVKHKSNDTNDPANNKRVYLINKKKIIIGRKQKLAPADSVSTEEPIVIDEANLIDEANPADIYIDNSSLVSRQHLSLQLKSCTGSSSEIVENKDTFWQMHSISKNGIFLNNHYIEKGKSIKLFLNKKYTMRFPNTNIKIYFETSTSSERSKSRLAGSFINLNLILEEN